MFLASGVLDNFDALARQVIFVEGDFANGCEPCYTEFNLQKR